MRIELKGVSFEYPGNDFGFKELDLVIEAGESIGICGKPGSGKTTLARLIAGLLRPQRGEVVFDGRPGDGLKSVRGRVGYLFQNPEENFFAPTLFEEVAYGFENLGVPGESREAVKESMADAGLDFEVYAGRNPFSLSLGEKRKAALASILVYRPELIVFDEFGLGLDAEAAGFFNRALESLSRRKATRILVSHEPDTFLGFVSRIIILGGSKAVLFDGLPAQLVRDPSPLSSAGLAIPPVVRLLHRLKEINGYSYRGADYSAGQIISDYCTSREKL